MGSARTWAVVASTAAVAAGAQTAGPVVGLGATVSFAIVAWLAMQRASLPTGALLCVVALGVSLSFPDGLVAEPLAALSVQAPGEKWLFGVRLLLLGLTLWAHQDEPEPRRTWILALVGAWFLISLAVRVALVVYVPLALVLLGRRSWPPLPTPRLAARVLFVALALLTPAGAALARRPVAATAPAGRDPAVETRQALAQGNLFHAQFWALRWAGGERDHPDAGHETLMEIELRLGHVGRAEQLRAELARARATDTRQPAGVTHP